MNQVDVLANYSVNVSAGKNYFSTTGRIRVPVGYLIGVQEETARLTIVNTNIWNLSDYYREVGGIFKRFPGWSVEFHVHADYLFYTASGFISSSFNLSEIARADVNICGTNMGSFPRVQIFPGI